ncbi:hypothetical protein RCL1_008115 [Eukaryota sp. TZLM3-RCL]
MPNRKRTLKSDHSDPSVDPALAVNAKVVLAGTSSTRESTKAPEAITSGPKSITLKTISHNGTILPTVGLYNGDEKSTMSAHSTFQINSTEKIKRDLIKLKNTITISVLAPS